ncbi:hypothetical protein DFQ26_007139 [Actinomortierella ambigua]|nr:hypothetical protein DFQ26_007139 [Actinomortierella ambigua]
MSTAPGFTLGECIGQGGIGEVHAARWNGAPVAAKRFLLRGQDALIQSEVGLIQELRHQHIIDFVGLITHQGSLYMLTDYAEGGSLQALLDTTPAKLNWPAKSLIAHEIAQGLAYIHSHKLLHRDLKSANVLLTRYLEVKLSDFGMARLKMATATKAYGENKERNLRWMAPELLAINPLYSTKSDVYALGMVMWEMAAECTTPFPNQADHTIIATHVKSGGRETVPDNTPAEYRRWIERCWVQEPSMRPEAKEMAQEDMDNADAKSPFLRSPLSITSVSSMDDHRMPASGSSAASSSGISINKSSSSINNVPGAISNHYDKESTPGFGVDATIALANQGDADAQFELGRLCYSGEGGFLQDYVMSFEWYFKAAEHGQTQAQNNLGWMYQDGKGIAQDDVKAVEWYRLAAEQGDAKAQGNLGLMYEIGRGVAHQDDLKAVEWYRLAAEQGNSTAQTNLGWMYQSGRGVAPDDLKAALWYRKAAEQNNPVAQSNLGWMYLNGKGLPQSDSKAFALFSDAAEQGNAAALNNLGVMYSNGRGTVRNIVKGAELYHRASELGDAFAKLNLSSVASLKPSLSGAIGSVRRPSIVPSFRSTNLIPTTTTGEWTTTTSTTAAGAPAVLPPPPPLPLQSGLGGARRGTDASMYGHYLTATPLSTVHETSSLNLSLDADRRSSQDSLRSIEWYVSAADQGDPAAQNTLGNMYKMGRGGVERDDVKAVEWYRRAAAQDYASAQNNLGYMYQIGRGVAQDDHMALEWYQKAADQGFAASLSNLGWMHQNGRGTPADNMKALAWYRRAAEQGYAAAQYNLGHMYDNGNGCPQDYSIASDYYTKAANQGHANAAYNLARMYKEGRGLVQDYAKAVDWYTKAAEKGHAEAQMNLGWLYQNGRGVPKDTAKASEWLNKASKQGVQLSVMKQLRRLV